MGKDHAPYPGRPARRGGNFQQVTVFISGEKVGRGNRRNKSRRYHESIPPDTEIRNKGELIRKWTAPLGMQRQWGAISMMTRQESAEVIVGSRPAEGPNMKEEEETP